jgi:hypothetical protein
MKGMISARHAGRHGLTLLAVERPDSHQLKAVAVVLKHVGLFRISIREIPRCHLRELRFLKLDLLEIRSIIY